MVVEVNTMELKMYGMSKSGGRSMCKCRRENVRFTRYRSHMSLKIQSFNFE